MRVPYRAAITGIIALVLAMSTFGQEGKPPQRGHIFKSGTFLTAPSNKDPIQVTMDYCYEHLTELGVESSDIENLQLARCYKSDHNGITHFQFQQTAQGLDVVGGKLNVNITRNGRILNIGSHLVPGAWRALNTCAPAIKPGAAIASVALACKVSPAALPMEILAKRDDVTRQHKISFPRLSKRVIDAQLKAFPVKDRGLILVWSARIDLADGSDSFEAFVDACNGNVIARTTFVAHGEPQYKVFALPVESPAHGSQSVVNSSEIVDFRASPADPDGWVDFTYQGIGVVVTNGNNASAKDTEGYLPNAAPDGHFLYPASGFLTLDFLNQNPLSTYTDAAITNLFYTCNALHDIFHQYGFNEEAGNFQLNNFSRGGSEGDSLNAVARSWYGNGSFQYAPDGDRPDLFMGIWGIFSTNSASYSSSGASNAVSIAAANVNSDNYIDLITANEGTANVSVFLNNGSGGFSSVTNYSVGGGASGPSAVVAGDWNRNGKVDLAVACAGSGNVSVMWNNGSGAFTSTARYSVGTSPRSIVAADLDKDSSNGNDLDLAVANSASNTISLLRNNSTASSFTVVSTLAVSAGSPWALVAGDFNADGRVDLAVANKDADKVTYFRNNGAWSFQAGVTFEVGTPGMADTPVALTAADLTGDSLVDLAIANLASSTISVLRNNGNNTFTENLRLQAVNGPRSLTAVESTATGGSAPLNLNSSEDASPIQVDLAVASSASNILSSRLNRGSGVFGVPAYEMTTGSRGDYPLSGSPYAVVAAKLNDDGHVDLAVALKTNPTTIVTLYNNGSGACVTGSMSIIRDNSLDNGYIAHEWGHGISSRIMGSSDFASTTQGNGMYEGWSDFFALAVTQKAEPQKPRGLFTFWHGDPADGPGLRSLPYSTDHLINFLTLNAYNERTVNGPEEPSYMNGQHAVGEIWASTLWDLYWKLCGRYGKSNDLYLGGMDPNSKGDNIALQLIIDGLKLQPPYPSFLQARDAILLADSVDYGGKNLDLIWEAFKDRGFGWNACDYWSGMPLDICGGPGEPNATLVKEAFDLPPLGSIQGMVFNDFDCDGTRDGGEPGISGRTVFLDRNQNGQLDSGEPTSTTDSGGTYHFTGLYPSTYFVAELLPSGWKQRAPNAPVSVLMGTWNGSADYADLWGEGDVVLLAHKVGGPSGVDIIDIRDPSNPQLAARWDSPECSGIEDVKIQDGIGYFACGSAGGVVIVDVRNPFGPVELARITAADGGFDSVHNVFVCGDYIYLASCSGPEVPVFRISTPETPVYVRTIDTTTYGGGNIHDITVVNGRLYACATGSPGYIHIYDVANMESAAPHLGSFVSGEFTHSCWPTSDGNYLCVTREPLVPVDPQQWNKVYIWDIHDPAHVPAQPSAAAVLPPTEALCAHHPRVSGNLLYVAWYAAGVVVFDVSNPLSPVQVGRYDTMGTLPPEGMWVGVWGVDPFLGEDRIIASDTETGLYIFSDVKTHVVSITEGQSVQGKDFATSQACN